MEINKGYNSGTAFPVTLAILAGGKNTRFPGPNKATFVIGGLSVAERILLSAGSLFDEIIVVTANRNEFHMLEGVRFASDIIEGKGPLGGIHAALVAASSPRVFILAADMPFVSPVLIAEQLRYFEESGSDIVVAAHSGKTEPLHSVFRKELAGKLGDFLALSQKTRDFLSACDTVYFELPAGYDAGTVFMNVNTPADAEKARGIAEKCK